jgi:hypothetical protein
MVCPHATCAILRDDHCGCVALAGWHVRALLFTDCCTRCKTCDTSHLPRCQIHIADLHQPTPFRPHLCRCSFARLDKPSLPPWYSQHSPQSCGSANGYSIYARLPHLQDAKPRRVPRQGQDIAIFLMSVIQAASGALARHGECLASFILRAEHSSSCIQHAAFTQSHTSTNDLAILS